MVIDNTSDKIQFKLAGAITTNQIPFTVTYNNYTASAVTPISSTGTSNDTTAVDLVQSPSSNEQNQVRGMSIENTDTVSVTVIMILFDGSNSRIFYQATLSVEDTLYYENERGFYIISANGSERLAGYKILRNSLNLSRPFMAAGVATSAGISNSTVQLMYLGRAQTSYSTMTFAYNVVVAIGATITYAELLVYKTPPGVMGKSQSFTRLGFTDCSGIWNSTGKKITAVTVSNINPGDDIWVGVSFSTSGTTPTFRAGVGDSSVILGTLQTAPSSVLPFKPSLVDTMTLNIAMTGANNIWISWQGT